MFTANPGSVKVDCKNSPLFCGNGKYFLVLSLCSFYFDGGSRLKKILSDTEPGVSGFCYRAR